MYPPDPAIRSVFTNRDGELADHGFSSEQRAAMLTDVLDGIRSSGLDAYSFGERLANAKIDHDLTVARGTHDPDQVAERIFESNPQVRSELRSTYGKEAEDLLRRANKFTKQFPKLHAILGTGAIGSRPDIVIPIVEFVRRINFR